MLTACGSTPKAPPRARAAHSQGWQPDWRETESYGLSPENPIQVGGGPEGQEAFLESLRGPEGQPLAWRRLGSCCQFETPNGVLGIGLLDMYEVIHEGQEHSVILYLDMYDSGPLAAPAGFTLLEEKPAPQERPSSPKVIEL
ncbi:hypothetical protein [Hyalangium gracile]|uniref:hypothetical protein n=1 Tax=Hyalangium gracile TaxID=394092 RepID=UPI001CCFA4DE|nr:hypothetical protein [Hyalangium gracile]